MWRIENRIRNYNKEIDRINEFVNYTDDQKREMKNAERQGLLSDLGRNYAEIIFEKEVKETDQFCNEKLKSIHEEHNSDTLKKLKDEIKNNLDKPYDDYKSWLEWSKNGGQRTPFEKRLKADLILLARSRKIHVTQSMSKSHIISLLRK